MYSWEIEQALRNNNYNIPSSLYLDICKTSPQIGYLQYNDFGDEFVLRTYDGYVFNFKVHRDTP